MRSSHYIFNIDFICDSKIFFYTYNRTRTCFNMIYCIYPLVKYYLLFRYMFSIRIFSLSTYTVSNIYTSLYTIKNGFIFLFIHIIHVSLMRVWFLVPAIFACVTSYMYVECVYICWQNTRAAKKLFVQQQQHIISRTYGIYLYHDTNFKYFLHWT